MSDPKPRRRWFRFSLRTLLIVVTLAGVICGWIGWNWRQIRERERMIELFRTQQIGFNLWQDPHDSEKVLPCVQITAYSMYIKWEGANSKLFREVRPNAQLPWMWRLMGVKKVALAAGRFVPDMQAAVELQNRAKYLLPEFNVEIVQHTHPNLEAEE